MWNTNNRRWLVKDKEMTIITTRAVNNSHIKHSTGVLEYELQQNRPKWSNDCAIVISVTAQKLKHCTTAMTMTTSMSSSTRLENTVTTSGVNTTQVTTTPTRRVNPCLNQIIEVLLAILLANCLLTHAVAQMPLAMAAFGAAATSLDDDALLSSLFSSRHSGGSSSSSSNSYSSNNDNYRHPFSIDSGSSAYNAYNAPQQQQQPLQQQNLDDFQTPNNLLQRSQNFKISPKPCSIGRIEGTCMFVWECIKSEGRHVGMCVDSFMFGSCCAHNYTDNIVLPHPQFSYTRPTKPMGISSLNHRPRPPHLPHKPSISYKNVPNYFYSYSSSSGMTTIERPHGAGTLVIRPSGPHHQGALHKPYYTKAPSTTSSSSTTAAATAAGTEDSNLLWTANAVLTDLQSAASISSPSAANTWNSSPSHHTTATSSSSSSLATSSLAALQHQQQHWHMTTEPNFITKPRPPNWGEKPTSLRPKPSKPTKKPPERPAFQQQTPSSSIVYSTRKPLPSTTRPKPQPPLYAKPTKTTTTTLRPYTRPTPSWALTSESVFSNGSSSSSSSGGNNFGSSTQSVASSTTSRTTTTTMITTSLQQYKPTTTTTQSNMATAKTSTTQRPYSTPTQQQQQQAQQQQPVSISTTTTLLPVHASLPSSSTSSSPSSTTTIGTSAISQTFMPHNLTTIESNEILDASSTDGMATIKTISAARSECGVPVLARPETRIVGGKNAAFGRWPWQVSVRRTSFFGFSSTHRCGGALINENWITTAGHCVDDLLISQIRIRVGEYDFSHVQEQLQYIERGVAKKVVHPKYNFFTYEYDLALVKLEQPLEFAPHVSPICLPQTNSLLIGMNATVTGWGRLSEGGKLPSVLQEVSVPIVSNDNCKTMFLRAGRQEFIPDIFLCAGYETGGQDSCQGDSGGPLQVKAQDGRFFLAGIISWGIGCAEANLPGVCTRISKFVPWILENVT